MMRGTRSNGKRRSVPRANLLRLDVPDGEDISRRDYERDIASPVRSFLAVNDPDVATRLTSYRAAFSSR